MVDKVENPKPTDEPGMTFDYSWVAELLPGSHMELSLKFHDHLSSPRHDYLFQKISSMPILPSHYIPKIGISSHLQYQGSGRCSRHECNKDHCQLVTLTELAYRAFGPLPYPHNEPRISHSPSLEKLHTSFTRMPSENSKIT